MLKAFSKAASKSIVAFVKQQLRNLRRKAFHRALSSGFQRLEPRRVLTVQGIFDAVSGNLSVNITPIGNTTATLGSLDASQFFLDIDGNTQFDAASDLSGLKTDLKNIFVSGTADPLGNIGTFVWKDHANSTFQLDQISAKDLSSISLDLLGKVSIAQNSSLQASSSVTIHNTTAPVDPNNTFLSFSDNLNLEASGQNGSVFVNLDYTLTVDNTLNLQALQGTIALSDIDTKELVAVASGNISDADSGLDSLDVRADKITLTSTSGSIGGQLTNILSANSQSTNAQALEIAARTPGSLNSSFIATQGTVSIFSSEFPTSADTNKLWIGSDANIQASDLSGLSSRISDLALVIDPANNIAGGILSLADSLTVSGDLRIQANSVTASDATVDLQANRILWNSIQNAEFTITANQIDAQSQNALQIKSTQAIEVQDLNNDSTGLQATGILALEAQQGSITLNSLVKGTGSTDILIQALAGGITTNANVQSGSGDITLSSNSPLVIEDRIRTSGPGSIVMESQGSVTIGQSTTFTTNNVNLGVFSGEQIRIGSINAGTAKVFLDAKNNILEVNSVPNATNITAQSVSMKAGGKIGDEDTSNAIFDDNRNAIVINASVLAASAADSIYIRDLGSITVDQINTPLSRVNFNSTNLDLSQTLEDLTATANNGNVKLQSLAGDIVINPGTPGSIGIRANGSGDVLLQTGNSGSILINADIVSDSGDITINSRGSLTVEDRLKTSRPGTIALISEARITVTALTTNSDLSIASSSDVVLGTINAQGASVFVSAGTSISDNDGNNNTLNINADSLQLRAGTRIGNSDIFQSNVNLNRQAITTQVNTLAARAATGIYVQERDAVTIDNVSNTVNRVNFNSTNLANTRTLEDLTTTNNGPVLIQSLAGNIVVNAGALGGSGISAHGTGSVLLQTLNSGTIITNADIQSGIGNITLASRDSLTIDQRLKTSSSGTIYLFSQGDLAINALNTNNTNLGANAVGNLSIGTIQAGTASVSLQANLNVLDNPNLSDPVNVSASNLTITAGGKIGNSDPNSLPNANANALITNVGSIAVRAANGAYIQEINGVTVESITNPLQQVLFRGNTLSQTQTLEDLSTTSNGPVKLQSLTGNIIVNAGSAGSNGISAHGTGDILLQALAGNVTTNAAITSGTGNITLDASGALAANAAIQTAGSVYLASGTNTSIQSISTSSGNVQILSGDSLTLGSINAGSGRVYLQATNDINDADPLSNSTNVTASALAMRAGGMIGNSDTTAPANTNRNAIGTRVASLAAVSATGVYIQEADGVTIDAVNVSLDRVNFNSTKTTQTQTIEDLTTTNNGPVKLQSLTGDIVVNPGTLGSNGITTNGTGDILLQTLAGSITSNAGIASGTGDITLDATGALTANAAIQTAGSVYLASGTNTSIQSITTSGGNLQILSGGDLTLGSINAGSGRVYLQAASDIKDADPLGNTTNVTASALAMRAGGKIGSSDTSAPANTNRNAIGTQVTTLAAVSATGIYIQESDGVTIDAVNVSLDRVNFNSTQTNLSQSLEDLTTTNNGPVKLQSLSGDIVVNPGTLGSNGITANGTGDILLQALAGGITTNANLQSGSGDITLSSNSPLVIEDRIRTSGPGSIVMESQGSVTIGQSTTFTTNNANLGVFSGDQIRIGSINAGTAKVFLDAKNNILEVNSVPNATNITAQSVSMKAGGKIGDEDTSNAIFDDNRNAIVINASVLAASAADSIYIRDLGSITVDQINTPLSRVNFNSSNLDLSQTLEDLTATANNGNVKLQSLAGDIVINPGTPGSIGIRANGSGDVLLQTGNSGSILINADIVSDSGDITINSRGSLTIEDRLKTSRPGTIALISEARITVTALTTNSDLSISSSSDVVLGTISAQGASVFVSAATSISDNDGNNSTLNINADSLQLRAGTRIGNSDIFQSNVNLNRQAITTQVNTLAARAATGIYVQERDAVTIDNVSNTVNRVNFNSTNLANTRTLEDLTTTNNGPVKLQSIAGNIIVNAGTAGSNGITANGSGDILLQTLNSGTVITNAQVQSTTGNITINSKDALNVVDRFRTTSPGTIYLKSDGNINVDSLNTNTNLQILSGGTLTLGSIDAGSSRVYLQATNDIKDADPLGNSVNVTASALAMRAGGKIGSSDTTAPANTNRNAIGTRVATLAAVSGTGIYIQEADGVTIDSVNVSVDRVNFNSTKTTQSQTLEDLSTTSNGPVKLQSLTGNIIVNAGSAGSNGISAHGTGDILLQALAGNVTTNASIASGTGNITLDASGALTANAAIQTAGSVYLSSGTNTSIQSISTSSGNVQILSGDSLTLGSINAGSGRVYLQATNDINDADPLSNSTNVTASALAMRAGGMIGNSDTTAPANTNRNAIGTRVASLAAVSATGVYIQEADGVTIDAVNVSLDRVNFNSTKTTQTQTIEDLTTTNNGPVKLQSLTGDIVVNPGTLGSNGITTNGTGDILLQTLAGSITSNAGIASGTGDITLDATGALTANAAIQTAGSVYLASGTTTSIQSISTSGGNLQILSGGDLTLGSINAGSGRVYLQATSDIKDADPLGNTTNVTASALAMRAGGKIGSSDTSAPANTNRNAIGTQVTTLAAVSATGIYIQESDGVTIDAVNVSLDRVNFNSTQTNLSQSLEDLTTTNNGPVKLQSLSGDIVVNPGTLGSNGITANGTGDILLQALAGGITTNANLQSGSGDITLSSNSPLVIEDRIRTSGPGSIVMESQGSVTIGQSTTFTTNNANLGVFSGDQIRIGSINAGTAKVFLDAKNNILEVNSVPNATNITAQSVSMKAGGKIGDEDTSNAIFDDNRNAIVINASVLAASAADSIYIRDLGSITVDQINTPLSRVNFNSTNLDLSQTLEDLTATANNGNVKLQSLAGDIVINPGTPGSIGIRANGSGDVLLQTGNSGSILINADVVSDSGDITINSRGSLTIEDRLKTSRPGTIALISEARITVTALTTNSDLSIASSSDVVLGTISAQGASVFVSAGTSISDNDGNNNTLNINADSLQLRAGTRIGNSDTGQSNGNLNRQAITTQVNTLAARAATGIYVQERDAVTIDNVSNTVNRVNFNSTNLTNTRTLEDLTTTNNGPVKLQSLAGNIIVNAGTAGSNGITANGSGDILLQTLNSGTVVTNAQVQSTTGNITINSKDALNVVDRLRTTSPGAIYLRSDGNINVDSLNTNTNLQILSGGTLTLGSIDAGSSRVYLQATNDIKDADPLGNSVNVTASALAMRAGGKIGSSDTTAPANTNRNAIGTRVATLAAVSGTGIYIQEADGVTIDSVNVSVDRVNFNSTKTTQSQTLEDLSTTSNGPVKLQSLTGNIIVNAGSAGSNGISAHGTGDVLLQALAGNVTTNASIASGTGNITLDASGALAANAAIQTAGSVYLASGTNTSIQSISTSSGNVQILSGGDLTLGSINAGSGRVYLQATNDINDADPLGNSTNVTASALAMRAGGKIGNSDTTAPANTNRNAIGTQVTSLAAVSASGIYIQEADGVTIDAVIVALDRVNFNSTRSTLSQGLEDLTTNNNGPVKLQSLTGDIVVNPGTLGSNGINANGTGDILLQTLAGSITSNAGIVSGTGDITLDASGALTANAAIQTAGSVYLASGANTSIQSITTSGGNLQILSGGDLTLGSINAGSGRVYLQATNDINDADQLGNSTNVTASALAMRAAGKIGSSDTTATANTNRNAIGTQVTSLAAVSATGIYIQEADGVTIDAVNVSLDRVNFNSTQTNLSQSLEDLTTTNNGPVKLQSLSGDIVVNPGTIGSNGITANGMGDILLQTLAGSITSNATIASGTGDITLDATGALTANAAIQTAGSVYLASGTNTSIQSVTTSGGNLQILSGGDLTLGSINAGSGRVYLQAASDIKDADPLGNSTNVTASALAMRAAGKIGNSDTTATANTNRNAIGTQVTTLAAVSATGIYIQESDGVTIDSVNVSVNRVNFNSTQASQTQTLEDLTTTNNGPVKLQSLTGDIVVNPGTPGTAGINAHGIGDILLQALAGNLTSNATIVSGSGNITLDATGALTTIGAIQTGATGSVYLSSGANTNLSSITTSGGNIQALSGGALSLGSIDAGSGRVYLQAANDIIDSDPLTNSTNVTANSLAMRAGGKIGDSDTSALANTNRNAIGTRVSALAAQSATGIYVEESDGVTIDVVSVSVDRVNFNSTRTTQSQTAEDLTTTNNGPVKLQSLSGDIVVNPGTAGSGGISANATGDILLETLAGNITTNAMIESGSGDITLDASGAITTNKAIQTAVAGSVYLSSGTNTTLNSITTAGGNVQILSGDTLTLGSIDAGLGRVYLQATNDIKDADPFGNSTNVTASALAMRAGGKIGNSDTLAPANTNRNAIGTKVSALAAESASGIYIQEADGVTIDSVNVSVNRVNFNSTKTTQSQSLEDLTTTNNGPVKLQSLAGDIVVNAGSAGTNGITAHGTGDILLETLNSGSILTSSVVMSDSGNITLNSKEALNIVDLMRTGSPATLYLRSSQNVTVDHLQANNDIAIVSGATISLGRIDAGSGNVYLEAQVNILDSDSSSNSTNIIASSLAMKAGESIGSSDLTNSQDSNRNAIGTQVTTLAAQAVKGIYVQEIDGVIIDSVSIGIEQVQFNSTLTDRSQNLEDLVTTDNGPIKLQSLNGDIVVRGGTQGTPGIEANGTGDVLLQTATSGTIITQAQVRSQTGNITINSVDDLTITDQLRTASPGVIYATSKGNVSIDSLDTQNTNLAIVSEKSIQLGTIQAGSGRVYLQAARDIADADPLSSTTNVTAQALAMFAGNKIGDSDLPSSADTNRHAIATKVDLLAARSSNGIYVQEADGLTVDSVFVASSKVNFNSSKSDESQVLEDLTTTIEGPIKLQSLTGNIQINPGAAGPFGVVAAVSGDILLQTLNSGTVILNGVVASELGDITINSKDTLVIGDKIQAGGPPKLATIYLRSDQNVTIEALTTNDSSLWVESGASIVLGKIQAGTAGVYLDAKEDIVNGSIVPAINIATRSILAMKAGGQIGPIVTQVDFLAAVAADGITISEIDGVTIGTGSVSVDQVHFNSSKTQRDATLEDLTTTNGGSIALESLAGDIVVEPGQTPGIGILANGSGQIVLLTTNSGNIIVRGDVLSGSGNISLSAADNVLLGAQVATAGDMVLESIRGAITESSERARVQADDLLLKSGSFAHLHDTTVNTLTARTLTNAVLSSWQELNLGASDQGDDFVDALGTVSESTKNALRAQYRFAERYQDIGYSLYVVNSKALTIDSVIAGSFTSGPLQSDMPGIYVETKAGDLLVKDEVVSRSASSQAGGVVLVSGAKVLLDPSATLQSNYIRNGVLEVQLINDLDLKARIFDALEKPNPAGGFFTTRIVSRNAFSESMLPENPVSPGPTKRILQGVSTHYGSTNESGFDLYIGYADGKLEAFGRQGDIYQRDNNNQGPIEARPQATGSVGYLERSNPFDGDFLNSTQELLTDVVIRRSDDFFIFQKDQPVGFDNFNPPNGPANTSTGFYDLTVQTHRVPDVISEGSDSGLPMPPAPEIEVPTFRQPEPYVVVPSVMILTESPEYEEPPVIERKSRIVISRIKVEVLDEGQDIVKADPDELENISSDKSKTVDIELPPDLLSDSGQLEGNEIERIRKYLDLQPSTKQGQYIIIVETSDGSRQILGTFIIGKEKLPDANPNSNTPPETEQPSDPDELPSGEDSQEENAGKPSNPNDQSLYLHPQTPKTSVTLESSLDKASDNDLGLMLGSLWLVRKTKELSQPESNSMTDYTIHSRRIRRLSSPENTQDQFVPDDTARE